MRITFLGTGTSQGVPTIACKCETCLSTDSKDKRLRSSILININDLNILIDSGPDFRQQMLREKIEKLDAILFSHAHKDHIAGLDDIRAFNYTSKKAMDVYAELQVQKALKREFKYAFDQDPYPGVPKIKLHTIANKDFYVQNTRITPIRVMHFELPILGFKTGEFAYITDANFIEDIELEKIQGIDTMVINALRKEKHISHYNLDEALEIIAKVKPQKAYLTHISHTMGLHCDVQNELPDNVSLAYDGLTISIAS